MLAAWAAASTSWGKCQELRLVDNFKIGEYTGLWYEQLRDKRFWPEKGDCQESRYALMGKSNSSMYVLHSQFIDNRTGFNTMAGVAKCKGAHCKVKYHKLIPEGDYRILETDYKTFALVYACESIFGVAKNEYIWLLSREKVVRDDVINKAKKFLADRLPWYNLNNLIRTRQGGSCVYLPVD